MQRKTIYDSFILKYFLSPLASLTLKVFGWKITSVPTLKKCVIIVAPHTSNWDFILALLYFFTVKMKVFVMLKSTAVKFLWRWLFLWLAVVPIDRSKSNNRVEEIAKEFEKNDEFKIIIPPAGTRTKVEKWKTGFYYIAHTAKVPILLAYGDYQKKEMGILDIFYTSGNVVDDMKKIKAIYKSANLVGKNHNEVFD